VILSSTDHIREYTEKGYWGTETIADLFLKNVRATPSAVALVDPPNRAELVFGEAKRMTYAELGQGVDKLANALVSRGIKKDDVLLVQLPNIVELAVVYLAAARIGAIVTPVPVQYRTHELKQVAAITEPKALITTKVFAGFGLLDMVLGLRPQIPSLSVVIAVGTDLPESVLSFEDILRSEGGGRALEAHLASIENTANDVFTICWTSGTEADPKGVPRSHNHWIWIAYGSIDGCEIKPGYALLNPFPMVSMAGIGGMFVPWLLTGGKLVLHHPLSLSVFLGQIGAEKVDYTVAPPALLTSLLMKPDLMKAADMSSLKNIGSGSAPLSPFMVREWQEKHDIRVVNIFGSNEGASFTSGPSEFADPTDRALYFPRFGVKQFEWTSRIASQMATKLVEPVTKTSINVPGIPGEMAIRSPGIFPGYYKRPDLTAKAFDAEGFFYTGDLFEIAGKGKVFDRYRFVGRLKDIIIRGGMNISSEEIEALIAEHPKVREVAVVGHPDERLGEKVCAVVVAAKGQKPTLEEVVDFLKAKDIAVYKLPERLLVVDALPRNPVGKVLKRLLRNRD
jgi:acyl-CoA synthetase (AMP-forming)/AMP-acid ligase II